jgi:hypothetical protein
MPVLKCAECGKEIEISEFQMKLMKGTIMTCSYECCLKAMEKQK